MTRLTSRDTSRELYTGSASRVRIWAAALRGTLAPLGAVLRAALPPILDSRGVEGSADHLVAEPRQILDTAAADEDDRVLLQVVALARDVRAHLHAVRQTNTGHLAEGRVRLLGGRRVDAGAHAALLGGTPERRRLHLRLLGDASLPDELIDGGHV